MKVAYDELYSIQLPDAHRFPMEKYELLFRGLLRSGIVEECDLMYNSPIDLELLFPIHDKDYVDRFTKLQLTYKEQRRTGFMHTKELVRRELIIVEATKNCALAALSSGIAFNIAGGTHHAYKDRGEGFCMLNDQAVAANYLLRNDLAKKVLIIDLDVHQGNGTASIFHSDSRVFTFSMHGKNNYPLHKEYSDRDVVLEDGTDDGIYLEILEKELRLLESVQADFVFYQSGVDILESDRLGRLAVSAEGAAKRDELVFDFAKRLSLPVTVTMGGGYSERVADIVDAHINTFKAADRIL